ncbi:MAG: DNA topoisomerase 4 subunit A, partial [Spiroplasma sp.]|nr:DNA topoisomerase 4 subunit A [Mycoplasmatales bacterium]
MKTELDIREFLDISIEEIFADRFARYSKYIIQDRALPDVRDGLKPVQRRIIYSMNKEGNNFDKPFRKAAKTVGNVIGNYHPHGDTSVYDAMVRMSQNWKVNNQLVIMHGNNGSIDGDSAAAMRYTETKLSEYSEMMVRNITENTVKQIPNFDDTELEPTVLPTQIPNLLINGASGISSGYATDIPPHNLSEIIKGTMLLNRNKDVTLDELMEIIKGPDFPTQPIVQGIEGIKEAYETGRGKIVMRAKCEIKKNVIIVSSIPYEVNKSTLLQRIDLIRIEKKVEGISEIIDQSDQSGLEIHINCKKDANIDAILKYLLKSTDLQKNYNFNMIAINNRKPELLGIKKMLQSFLNHRVEVITKRSEYRLEKANQKLHILEGLIKAVNILDEIIEIIKASSNKSTSKENIMKRYDFSEYQAEAIVMMQLYRLSNTDLSNLEENVAELQKLVKKLTRILSDKNVLKAVIEKELNEVLERFGKPRTTIIQNEIEEIKFDQVDLIKAERMLVSITSNGYLKRSSPRSYASSQSLGLSNLEDNLIGSIISNTKNKCLVFFDDGSYVIIPGNDIVETKWKDIGKHISSLCKVNDGVRVINIVSTIDFNEYVDVVSVSQQGHYTKIKFKEFDLSKLKQRIVWQKLKTNDKIVSLDYSSENPLEALLGTNAIFVTNLGRYIKTSTADLDEHQLRRTGKRISPLRKNEELNLIKIFSDDLILFTDKFGYFKIKEEMVVN